MLTLATLQAQFKPMRDLLKRLNRKPKPSPTPSPTEAKESDSDKKKDSAEEVENNFEGDDSTEQQQEDTFAQEFGKEETVTDSENSVDSEDVTLEEEQVKSEL